MFTAEIENIRSGEETVTIFKFIHEANIYAIFPSHYSHVFKYTI